MTRDVSPERKSAYYIGTAISVLGFLLFASVFVSFALNFGDFSHFDANVRSFAVRAFAGMALVVVGGFVRGVGERGLAGSGVILDPEQARQDLEPYARMAGGMVKDALDEADVHLGGQPERVVMLKCPTCGKLNEEDSKFCQECGATL